MRVNPGDWGEDNLQNAERRGRSVVSDCPFCGKSEHFYLHVDDGYYICFGKDCGERGGDLLTLISKMEGITIGEAQRRLMSEAAGGARRTKLPKKVRTGIDATERSETEMVDVAIPPTMIPVLSGRRWRMPRYLLDRGVSRRLASQWGMGYCPEPLCSRAPDACQFPDGARRCVDYGRCRYARRIILPIECPGGRSFTARAIDSGSGPRYLNPPAPKGRLLFGWKSVFPECELVLCEGPFDAIRLAGFGFATLAVMGVSLSREQRFLLASLNTTSITIMLDAGVEGEAILMAESVFQITERVYIAHLPDDIDPGESTFDQLTQTFRLAEQFSCGRESYARSAIRKVRMLKK